MQDRTALPSSVPYPPFDLANRVGALEGANPWGQFDWIGRRGREDLCALLPSDWDWRGRRVLDLGCGVGRTLRHFVDEARIGDIHGCDIDVRSVEWLQQNLCPPFTCL